MSLKERAFDAARTIYSAVEQTGVTRGVHHRLAELAAKTGLTVRANLHTGDVLHVDLAGTVGRSIWLRGRYDEALVAFLLAGVRPGDVFLDVGANVGYYTAMATRAVGPRGLVIAVEPGVRPLSMLARSIADNEWRNVIVCSLGASASTRILRFTPERDSGLSRVSDEGAQAIGAAALDDVLGPWLRGKNVGALKLDVEHHELEALAGMERTFATTPPRRVLTEAHVASGGEWLAKLFAFFTTRGYRAVDPADGRAITIADLGPELWNVGFVREEA